MDKEKLAKVAVIIPSLNSARYIDECIQSVQNQSLKDLQILCVDAKSEDGTLEILAHYAKNDDRIQIILSDKKSYGYQMNLGIKAAKAEYIGIVESDDYIKARMYEELYSLAKAKDCEVVKSDMLDFVDSAEGRTFKTRLLNWNKGLYNKMLNAQMKEIYTQANIMNPSGIYKLEFLKKYKIFHNETPGASYQDTGFWFQINLFVKRMYFINKAYYYYRQDNDSSSVNYIGYKKALKLSKEYDFMRKLLDTSAFSELIPLLSFLRFGGYNWVLNRIMQEDLLAFLQQIQSEFKELYAKNEIDEKLFDEFTLSKLQRIMRNPQEYYDNVVKKPKGAVERVKNHLAYKLGFAIIKAKNPLKFLLLPFNIVKISMDHRFEQKIIKILLKLKPEFRPLPLDQYSDSEDSLRVKEHLSYKLGKALLKNPLTFIFKISGIYKDYKRNKK